MTELKIEQFGPESTFLKVILSLKLNQRQDNPFGEVGDTYAISFSLKDQRGKYRKD